MTTKDTPPPEWIGTEGEWIFFTSLIELDYEPNKDFTYRPSGNGTGNEGVSFSFENPPNLAVNVQSVYYTNNHGTETRSRDIFTREALAGLGITLIFVDQQDLEQDALGITREALDYKDSSRLGRR